MWVKSREDVNKLWPVRTLQGRCGHVGEAQGRHRCTVHGQKFARKCPVRISAQLYDFVVLEGGKVVGVWGWPYDDSDDVLEERRQICREQGI